MAGPSSSPSIIYIDYPFPEEFRCPECYGKPGVKLGGVYKSRPDLMKHVKKYHPGHNVILRCGVCGEKSTTTYPLRGVKAHHAAAHGASSGRIGTGGASASGSTDSNTERSPPSTTSVDFSGPGRSANLVRLALEAAPNSVTTTTTTTTMTTTATTTTTATGVRRTATVTRTSGGAPPPSSGPAVTPTTRAAATSSTTTTTTTTSTATRRTVSSSLVQQKLPFGPAVTGRGVTTGTNTTTKHRQTPPLPPTVTSRAKAVAVTSRTSKTPPPPSATRTRTSSGATTAPSASVRRSATPPLPPAPRRTMTTRPSTTPPPPTATTGAAAPAPARKLGLLSLKRNRPGQPSTTPPTTATTSRPVTAVASMTTSRKSATPPPPPAPLRKRTSTEVAAKKLPSPSTSTATATTTKRDGVTAEAAPRSSTSGIRAAPAVSKRVGTGTVQRTSPGPPTRKSTSSSPPATLSGPARRTRGSTVSPKSRTSPTTTRGLRRSTRGTSVPVEASDVKRRTSATTTTTRRKTVLSPDTKRSPRGVGKAGGQTRTPPGEPNQPYYRSTVPKVFTSVIRTAASPTYAAVTAGATVATLTPPGGPILHIPSPTTSSASPCSPTTIIGQQDGMKEGYAVSCVAVTLTTTTVTTTVSEGSIMTTRPLAGGVDRGFQRTRQEPAVLSLPPIAEVTVSPGPARTASSLSPPAIGAREEEGREEEESPLPWQSVVSGRRRRQLGLFSPPSPPSVSVPLSRSPLPETSPRHRTTPTSRPSPTDVIRTPGPSRTPARIQRPPSPPQLQLQPQPEPQREPPPPPITATRTAPRTRARPSAQTQRRQGTRRGAATGGIGNSSPSVSERAPENAARVSRSRDLRDMFNRLGGFASRFRSMGGNNPGRSDPSGSTTGASVPAGRTDAPSGVVRASTTPQPPRDRRHRRPTPVDQPNPRPRASRRREQVALAEERGLLIDLAEAVDSHEDLEEVATQIATFFKGFGSQPAGVGGRTGGRSTTNARGRGRVQSTGPSGRPDRVTPRGTDQVREATRLQRLFRQNRRRAVQEVLMGAPAQCQVPKDRVTEHFRNMYSPASTPSVTGPLGFPSEAPTAASDAALITPFEVSEIDRRLRRMSNSAPGPDGLTYRDLRKADPGCKLLTAYYNMVRRLESVPSSWKCSNTVLIHKKGDRMDLGNWRPLAMSDTTPKLFAAVLADRLVSWTLQNGRLSPQQKGFLPCEGCYEHNYTLQEILNDARRGKGQVVVAWLDLSNAFGSIPHSTIYHAFAEAQVPVPFRNIVEGLYDRCTTRVRTSQGFTDPVPILSGVKQGCPLSPVAFNLALEPVLRAAARSSAGYTLHGQRYNILAYADDLVLVSDTPAGMEALLGTVEATANGLGLRFNPAKCATLHQDSRGTRRAVPTCFSLQGQGLKSLAAGVPYEHLGVPTGFQVKQTPLLSIEELIRDLHAVDRSLLAPWQKCETVASFILPRLDFLLRGASVEKGPLKVADKLVRKLAKSWLNLPQRASAEVVYLPPSRGGCGLLPLADLADAMTIGHAFRLLTAPDPLVNGLARESLKGAVARKIGRQPTEQDLATYLSGSLEGEFARTGGDFSTLWSRARNAARRSSNVLQLRWEWCAARQELGIRLRGSRGRTTVVTPNARDQVLHRLRAAVTEFYCHRLASKPDQGKVFGVSSRTRVSNHFLRGGSFTRFADWRFIHRARLDVLPLNGARRWGDGDKRCRLCGASPETIPHVLCHCRPHSAAWQLRHDSVVSRIARACRLPGTLRVNQRVEGLSGDLEALRPDIVIRHEPSKSVVIVDVTVTFENGIEAFHAARGRKISKYLPIAAVLEERGYRVVTDAIVVGALGSWDQDNEPVLSLLRIGKTYAGLMRRLIVSETIRWARDIYVEHVSGVRQYAAAPVGVPRVDDTLPPSAVTVTPPVAPLPRTEEILAPREIIVYSDSADLGLEPTALTQGPSGPV